MPGKWCAFVSCAVAGIFFPFCNCQQHLPPADFFLKHAVAVMTVRELFDFVTDPSITHENMDAYLSKVRQVWGQA